jgi:hypothetical protein
MLGHGEFPSDRIQRRQILSLSPLYSRSSMLISRASAGIATIVVIMNDDVNALMEEVVRITYLAGI